MIESETEKSETTNSSVLNVDYVLLDAPAIAERVKELAEEIMNSYEPEDEIILLCLLKGSFIFCADLSRAIERPHEIDFMAVSSYGRSTESTGSVEIVHDLQRDIFGRHVLIIEDIIDSGYTLSKVTQILQTRHPASLRICTLLDKPERREVEVPVDFVGFAIPDEFVVGYGLDFDEKYRNLPYVAVLKDSVFEQLFIGK